MSNDNFPTPSGGNCLAGISLTPPPSLGFAPGGQLGSLTGDWIFTPGRNSEGLVTQASIDTIPANHWVAVSGSDLMKTRLMEEAAPYLFNWTADNWGASSLQRRAGAWNGWMDDGYRCYRMRDGGHDDSSMNGSYVYDFQRMLWDMLHPSDQPDNPLYPWHPNFKASGSYTLYRDERNVSTDINDGLASDMLPSKLPTSAHLYGGTWYDSKRHQVGTGRVSKWTFDLTTRKWLPRQRWIRNGVELICTIRQEIHYYEPKDMLFGFWSIGSDNDRTSMSKCQMPGSTLVAIPPPTGWYAKSASTMRYDEHTLLFIWHHPTPDVHRYAFFDMRTETWSPTVQISNATPMPGLSEMPAGCLVPQWGASGRVIRRGVADPYKGAFWQLDLATGADIPYTPLGRLPAETARPGNKPRWMPKLGICVWFEGQETPTSPSIYIMRPAP